MDQSLGRVWARRVGAGLLSLAVIAGGATSTSHGQTKLASNEQGAPEFDFAAWADSVWISARSSSPDNVLRILDQAPASDASAVAVRTAVDHLKTNIAKREEDRGTRSKELSEELDKTLATAASHAELSKALRSAVELELLATDRAAFVREPRITKLEEKAAAAAQAAERKGDWMVASELFVRLHALMEESGKYKKDSDRVMQRLAMLRLYVPQRLWELRNQRQLEAGEDPLPPYNPLGDDYKVKLRDIDEVLLLRALQYVPQHVEQVPMKEVLIGGIEAVRTMVTTTDLSAEFKGLSNGDNLATFNRFLDERVAEVQSWRGQIDYTRQVSILRQLTAKNDATLVLPRAALLHEFGTGMMAQLDDFSAIIWPDEVRRFQRSTQGKLVGIGVSIEFDPQSNIRVVSPLEGTPAQRAGIHAGDVIKKVDGNLTYGMSLDQAVDVITGPAGTNVTVTVEREEEDGLDAEGNRKIIKRELDFSLSRAVIDLITVKGWKRQGAREDDWDWFVDADAGIGYVRLTQFTDTTTRDFDRAIAQMQDRGLNGLILDLRFNPGGLLDQAVEIVRRFVDVERGTVVMMAGRDGIIESSQEYTRPSKAKLAKTPVVVLINENSASASEIVSGALKHYGMAGGVDGGPAIKAIVVGERSFGKGSVQNVWPMGTGAMKLTIQYYMLPDRKIIHRKLGAAAWGVEPDLRVDMLPKQTTESLTLRRNADVLKLDEKGVVADPKAEAPNPDDLLTKGLDPQLEMAVVLLKTQAADARVGKVAGDPR